MTTVHGRIDRSGGAALEGVAIRLTIRTTAGGLKEWAGSFSLPAGNSIMPQEDLSLTLDDGRRGKAVIREITATSNHDSVVVYFQGTGALS